jgi:hypothetical protein
MGALGLGGEGKLAEKIIEDERGRPRNILFCRFFGNGRKLEARLRVIKELCLYMVAGLGEQCAVPAEHRRVDDAGKNGQRRIGGGEERFDQAGGRRGWNELIALADPAPVREPRQHVSQALFAERRSPPLRRHAANRENPYRLRAADRSPPYGLWP